jgi:hypothetical protein
MIVNCIASSSGPTKRCRNSNPRVRWQNDSAQLRQVRRRWGLVVGHPDARPAGLFLAVQSDWYRDDRDHRAWGKLEVSDVQQFCTQTGMPVPITTDAKGISEGMVAAAVLIRGWSTYLRLFTSQMRDAAPIWERPLRAHRMGRAGREVVLGPPYRWPRWAAR